MDIKLQLKQYLIAKKWAWKPASGSKKDIVVQICPFCGNENWKFSIHAKDTKYRCFVCEAKGNLYTLKRALGDLDAAKNAATMVDGESGEDIKQFKPVPMVKVDRFHANLMKHKRTLKYLQETRGFDRQTIKHFKFGLQKKHGRLWLCIPHINDGVCHNIKFRALPPAKKTFRRVGNAASVLYNADALAEYEDIVIAEGELDAAAFWQAGVKNVVGLTGGAGTFPDSWYDVLVDKEKITLVLDADPVGQKGARDIARRLGFDRCENVLLPCHDANECLVVVGSKELRKSLETAERFEVGGVITLADAMLLCKNREEIGEAGLMTPWESVNAMAGRGFQPGDLVILSARVKTGKTTLALNWALFLANQGYPVLFQCLEMSTTRLTDKATAVIREREVGELTSLDYTMGRWVTRNTPFYYIDPDWQGGVNVNNVFDKIREAVKRYGIKFVLFDNIHFLCRSLQYVTTEVGQISRGFKLLAEELDIVICCIAQPRKVEGSRMMSHADIKDSSAIPADADWVIIMHREVRPVALDGDIESNSDAEVMSPKTILRFDATRFQGGGDCLLYYDGAAAKFYDWKDRPVD